MVFKSCRTFKTLELSQPSVQILAPKLPTRKISQESQYLFKPQFIQLWDGGSNSGGILFWELNKNGVTGKQPPELLWQVLEFLLPVHSGPVPEPGLGWAAGLLEFPPVLTLSPVFLLGRVGLEWGWRSLLNLYLCQNIHDKNLFCGFGLETSPSTYPNLFSASM